MDDIEKSRVEYVARLEEQVAHLHRMLSEVQPLAEKWTPVVSGSIDAQGTARITLSFGGKLLTATVSESAMLNNTAADLTTSVTNTLSESLLVDRLRDVVRPEVERLLKASHVRAGAGKW